MNTLSEVVGLTNLYDKLAALMHRKVTRDEQRKLSVISGKDSFTIDGFDVTLKKGTFCCYIISEII
jgi:hypothetical protein